VDYHVRPYQIALTESGSGVFQLVGGARDWQGPELKDFYFPASMRIQRPKLPKNIVAWSPRGCHCDRPLKHHNFLLLPSVIYTNTLAVRQLFCHRNGNFVVPSLSYFWRRTKLRPIRTSGRTILLEADQCVLPRQRDIFMRCKTAVKGGFLFSQHRIPTIRPSHYALQVVNISVTIDTRPFILLHLFLGFVTITKV
jgi:hypothetical protein